MAFRCQKQADTYRSGEELFGFNLTTFPLLEQVQQQFEPWHMLWRICGEFLQVLPDWKDGPFPNIDAALVAASCDRWACLSVALILFETPATIQLTKFLCSCRAQAGTLFRMVEWTATEEQSKSLFLTTLPLVRQ
jgi:hypothetical protein